MASGPHLIVRTSWVYAARGTNFLRTIARLAGERKELRIVANIACAGETSWHGFATAIVDGLRSRGVKLEVETIIPIRTHEFPTKAKRPANSRLDLTRLRDVFGIVTPSWSDALAVELDELARELI